MTTPPTLIFGAAGIAAFSEPEAKEVFSILDKHNVKVLDSAYLYTNSEETLKKYNAPAKYIIHTKAPTLKPGALSKENVLAGMKESLTRLGVSQVDLYYLHAPDETTPISETLEAITQLHKEGSFKEFGLSNFRPAGVQEIYDIQKSKNAVLPTVFQGNYNAVGRLIEDDLFPLLRKLNIAFNAYSPIAGGFLVKSSAAIRAGELSGRWEKGTFLGDMYSTLYGTDAMLKGLDTWADIAKDEGISKAALAYRWVVWHSALKSEYGDGVILGATKPAQLEESLSAIEQGPLSEKSVERIEAVWRSVKEGAPLDNYHSYMKK